MKKIGIGDVISVNKEHIEHLESIKGNMDNSTVLMRHGADEYKQSEKLMWAFIHSIIPETIGFHMTYNHEDHKLRITGDNK